MVDNVVPEGGRSQDGTRVFKHAPKITKSDQRLSFLKHSASEASLRARVCGGSLWTNVYPPVPPPKAPKKAPKKGSSSEPQDGDLVKLPLELPLTYPHPLEESTKGSPKRVIFEEVSEIPVEGPGLEKQQQYQPYQRLLQSLNSSGSASLTLQQVLDAAALPSPSDASHQLCWLLRFGEDGEYVDVDVDVTAEGRKQKPRVSWGVCTTMGLDNAKEEDRGAVTFVMMKNEEEGDGGGKVGLLRVGKIKVEGKGTKSARQVVNELAVKVC